MQQKRFVDLSVLGIFVIVTLVCVIVFLLPTSVQDTLKTKTDNTNPLTFLTSVFVHGNIEHLVGNVAVFVLAGLLLYYVNRKANHERFLLYSLLLLVIVLPLVYNVIFLVMSVSIFYWNSVSYGLSLIVAGCIGLLVPSLIGLLRAELQDASGRLYFFSGLLGLTGSIIVYPYLSSSFYSVTVFAVTLITGFLFLFKAFQKVVQFDKQKGTQETRKKIVLSWLASSVYIVLLTLMFPATIIQNQGSIVNIFAHYFGVFFGILVGFLILEHQK